MSATVSAWMNRSPGSHRVVSTVTALRRHRIGQPQGLPLRPYIICRVGPSWPPTNSSLVDHGITQGPDFRHLDFEHVARLEPHRRLGVRARAGGRAGEDDVAGLERGEHGDVADE